ncbi:hypothetical protein [Saccharothrix sp.]|uniref:hypothetical protein n=1 Tax=Saccharothrix sp. TaxID=1873460 RepID=UPI002810F66D|nr:hypothetical protein [Saccharothrix sp.]
MTFLVLLALGHLASRALAGQLRARGTGRRAPAVAEFGTTAIGGTAGLLTLALAGDLTPKAITTLDEALRLVVGDLAEPLTVLLLLAAILTALYGFCVATGHLVLLLELGLQALRHTEPHDTAEPVRHPDPVDESTRLRRAALRAYGRAVARLADNRDGDTPTLDVAIAGDRLRLNTHAIAARWTATEGWSAVTHRGRRWYPHVRVPPPAAVLDWLRIVGTRPHLGALRAPLWPAMPPDHAKPDHAADSDTLLVLLAAAAATAPAGLAQRPADCAEHDPAPPRRDRFPPRRRTGTGVDLIPAQRTGQEDPAP